MFDFIDKMTAYDLGIIIGLIIALFIVRFTWFMCVMIESAIERAVIDTLKFVGLEGTAFEKSVAAFFRRLGNLMTRYKWTDPKYDFNNGFDRMIDAMYHGTWSPEIQKKIDRDDNRREAWDKMRSSIVWTLVLIAITLYVDPWEWNLF